MPNIEGQHIIESKGTITWKENGIIHMVYKPNVILDINTMKQAIKDRTMLSDGMSQLFYIDARNVKYWTLESKIYGFSQEATALISASAVVISSHITITSWNWATSFLKLSIPTKLFMEKEPALKWLLARKKNAETQIGKL